MKTDTELDKERREKKKKRLNIQSNTEMRMRKQRNQRTPENTGDGRYVISVHRIQTVCNSALLIIFFLVTLLLLLTLVMLDVWLPQFQVRQSYEIVGIRNMRATIHTSSVVCSVMAIFYTAVPEHK